MTAIVVEQLAKRYGAVCAVDGLSFSVATGEVFGLLGPNGAGKTTTVEILEGYRDRTSGRVDVLGFDPATGGRAFRERIGIVLQTAGFEEEFSVRELMRAQAKLYPRRHDPDDLIDLVGLADKRTARVKTLSGGQRRRLDLALGLVGAPELLFLDEPTTGFDPSARHHAWELLHDLRTVGTTILLTTHYLDEAQRLADRVAVVRAGTLVAQGRPDELGDGVGAPGTVLTFRVPDTIAAAELPPLSAQMHRVGATVTATTEHPAKDLHVLTGWALERGIDLTTLTVARPSLEDVYLRLVGEPDAG